MIGARFLNEEPEVLPSLVEDGVVLHVVEGVLKAVNETKKKRERERECEREREIHREGES